MPQKRMELKFYKKYSLDEKILRSSQHSKNKKNLADRLRV